MKLDIGAVLKYFSGSDKALSGVSLQESLRRNSRRLLPLLGWPGIVAIGVLVMLAPFYVSTLRPLQERLNSMQRADTVLQERMLSGGKAYPSATTPGEELEEFYRHFPSETESPHWLGKLVEIAGKNGLSLNHGEYMVSRDRGGRMIRFKITLPVQGKYTQVRRFLSALNAEMPMMSLENVQFERKDVLDSDVQVKIKLMLYMVQGA
jgi:hypothetical protein